MALAESLAGLGATCIDMARSRIELFSLDLEDAVWRITTLFCVSLVAALLIFCASLFGAGAFLAAYWFPHPVWALLIVCAAYSVAGVLLLALVIWWFNRSPFLLSESIKSLHQDEQLLAERGWTGH